MLYKDINLHLPLFTQVLNGYPVGRNSFNDVSTGNGSLARARVILEGLDHQPYIMDMRAIKISNITTIIHVNPGGVYQKFTFYKIDGYFCTGKWGWAAVAAPAPVKLMDRIVLVQIYRWKITRHSSDGWVWKRVLSSPCYIAFILLFLPILHHFNLNFSIFVGGGGGGGGGMGICPCPL